MATQRDRASEPLLTPGRTCWRLDRAERVRCVQDGADYFRFVHSALLRAKHSVFILGWDISARTNLLPGEPLGDAPAQLDELLAYVALKRPQLRVFILVWDYGTLYTLERDPLSRLRLAWRTPRHVRFGYDDHHPFGASHHQKVVVVDDRIAFSGSLDLTGHRWDTKEHRVDEPDRVTPTGTAYTPYHEVQAMVEGPVAAALGELARERWRTLGARRLPPIVTREDSLWPDDVAPDLVDVDVAISRTVPGSESQPPIRECEALFFESIEAARKSIYIENQYFTSDRLGAALAKRLAEPSGPEVVVVGPRECHGWLEKTTMGAFREGVFRRLRDTDAHCRLRLVHPIASRSLGVSTFVHSKVMVVDDTLLRIGSANFSNRSLGMDTECDLSVAGDEGDVRRGIREVRNRLLAEHLGVDSGTVERGLRRLGTMAALIDSRAGADRTLARIEPSVDIHEPAETVRNAADPAEPIEFAPALARMLPAIEVSDSRSHLRLWIVPASVVATAFLVAWASRHPSSPATLDVLREVLPSISRSWQTTVAGAAVFIAGSWCLLPVELLVLAAGFALGAEQGAIVSAIGSVVAALSGYLAGRTLGPSTLARWINPRAYRMGRQLCAEGPAAVAVLRLATVATAGSIHLLCGAGRVRFRDYMLGSAIGLLPAIAALSALGGLLRGTLLHPTIWNGLLTIGFALLLAGVTFGLRTFLLIRQFAPVTAGHRTRAEYG